MQPCDERLRAKTGCACRGRIQLVSSVLSRGSRNSPPPLCAPQTDPRAGHCGRGRTVLGRRGSRRSSSWFEALADDGSRGRLLRGAHPREGILFSNGQTGLTPSRLRSYDRLRSPRLYHLAASVPYVREIAHYVDPRDNPCMNGPQIDISRGLLIPPERLYGNPRTALRCGPRSAENASPCGGLAQNARA